jgi:hypothetical protein
LIEHKVVVVHCELPIPTREWDWCAYYEDEEGQLHKYGWGKTRGEALVALARMNWAKRNVTPGDETAWPNREPLDEQRGASARNIRGT